MAFASLTVAPALAAALVAGTPGAAAAGFRESDVWRGVRTVVTAPLSFAAFTVAVAAGAACSWDRRHWISVCVGPRVALYRKGGTMYGTTFVTPNAAPDDCLRRHEARHTDQYVLALGDPIAFALAYGAAEVAALRTGGVNAFEADAGLAAGRYEPRGPQGCLPAT